MSFLPRSESNIPAELEEVERAVLRSEQELLTTQQLTEKRLFAIEQTLVQILNLSKQILAQVALPPPVSATMTLTVNPSSQITTTANPKGEILIMPANAVSAALDLPLPDSGSGVATLIFVDSVGLPAALPAGTIPIWSSSDPAIVVTPDADGLSAQFGPSSPPVLATGVVITAVTTLPDGTVITATGQPIDVVAGGPAGAQMKETVNP